MLRPPQTFALSQDQTLQFELYSSSPALSDRQLARFFFFGDSFHLSDSVCQRVDIVTNIQSRTLLTIDSRVTSSDDSSFFSYPVFRGRPRRLTHLFARELFGVGLGGPCGVSPLGVGCLLKTARWVKTKADVFSPRDPRRGGGRESHMISCGWISR